MSHKLFLVNVIKVVRDWNADFRVPLGMLYLGGNLRKKGYEIFVRHIEEYEIDGCIEEIRRVNPLFVGVTSVLTGLSTQACLEFSRKLKAVLPTVPIIWGGVQPSAIPKMCLQEDCIDLVCVGEGEETVVEVAEALQGTKDMADVRGLAFKKEGKIVVNERRECIGNLDDVAPDFSLIDLKRYIFNQHVAGLFMTSRGCPFSCIFCYNNAFNQRRWRAHSADFVVDHILALREQYDFSFLSFSDDNFMVNKNRAFDILERLSRHGIRAFSVDLKINQMMPEDVGRLDACGVMSCFFGTESLNPGLIRRIRKEQTREEVINGVKQFARYPNINLQTGILTALPFETKEEMRQDICDGLALYRYHDNFMIYFGILFPLPGTEMFEIVAEKTGRPLTALSEFGQHDIYLVHNICHEWLDWATPADSQMFRNIQRYSQILSYGGRVPLRCEPAIVRLAKRILFHLAQWRLRHLFFFLCEVDFLLFKLLQGLPRIKSWVVSWFEQIKDSTPWQKD